MIYSSGLTIRTIQSYTTTSTTSPTSTLARPTQSGDQPLEKNFQITSTYGGGSMLDTRKVGEKKDKDKEREKEKSLAMASSLMLVINLNGKNNSLDG